MNETTNTKRTTSVASAAAATGGSTARLAPALLSLAILAGCGQDAMTTPSPGARLVEAGWSFGFCLGACRGTLSVAGSDVSYEVTNRTGDAVVAASRGELTASGSARLEASVAALPASLLQRYGCPDCSDAGAAYVVLERSGSATRSEYEYPSPPPELAALDGFLRELMADLGSCRSSSVVRLGGSCVPVPE